MEIAWALGMFFIFCIMVFVALAVFVPEWVGITGKVAKKNIEEHKEGSKVEDTL